MDWNVLFQSPDGYSLVTNQILRLLDYKTIMVCRDVSPIWKEYIDNQRFWRVSHLLSLMDKYFEEFCDDINSGSFAEKFPEWNKIIPYIKTEMSASDMDVLIGSAEFYTNFVKEDCMKDSQYEDERDQVEEWCPLHFAVYLGNVAFVEVMIRTPFDFNTLKFIFENNNLTENGKAICQKCDWINWINSHQCSGDPDEGFECVYDNSVLHQAARNGDIKMIKLILKFAEEKKIDINAENKLAYSRHIDDAEGQTAIVTAKDDPEVVKLLLKHCEYDGSDLGKLGVNTLEYMAKFLVEEDEPSKKKMKLAKN